jgi:hypothetical protein
VNEDDRSHHRRGDKRGGGGRRPECDVLLTVTKVVGGTTPRRHAGQRGEVHRLLKVSFLVGMSHSMRLCKDEGDGDSSVADE